MTVEGVGGWGLAKPLSLKKECIFMFRLGWQWLAAAFALFLPGLVEIKVGKND